jgi:DNA-directed RNA polymerase subunit delta
VNEATKHNERKAFIIILSSRQINKTNASLSMLELAEAFLRDKNEDSTLKELTEFVFSIKSLDVNNQDTMLNFYMDITQSAKFVYCGEDKWNLKEFNLDLWDKDGHAFVSEALEAEDELEEDLDFTEFNIDDLSIPLELEEEDVLDYEDDLIDDEEKVALREEQQYIDVEISLKPTGDDDDFDVDIDKEDYDEEDYNEIMDDYENMYDD